MSDETNKPDAVPKTQPGAANAATSAVKKFAQSVDDIQCGNNDATDSKITKVYGRRKSDYAVYQTQDRAAVQYADDQKSLGPAQRKWMAPLNVLRAQIDALVDGWRKTNKDKAKGYDARVAAALILCLEEDVTGAQTSLTDIKNDVLAERNSRGRFEYLISASLVALAIAIVFALGWAASVYKLCTNPPLVLLSRSAPSLLIETSMLSAVFGAIVGCSVGFWTIPLKSPVAGEAADGSAPASPRGWGWVQWLSFASIVAAAILISLSLGWTASVLISCPFETKPTLVTSLLLAGMGGVAGAFFSIAIGIMGRTVLTSLNRRDNLADAVLRVIVGLIAAWVLVLLVRENLVVIPIGTATAATGLSTGVALLVGFVAGFLERLVPDLLEKKAEDKTKEAEERAKQAEGKAKQAEEKLKLADEKLKQASAALTAELATTILGAAHTYAATKPLTFDGKVQEHLRAIAATAAADILKEPSDKQDTKRKEADEAFRKLIDKLPAGAGRSVDEQALNEALKNVPIWPLKS